MVSIVLCFLNGARWIPEAIESILQQHFTDWELILVDDGSTDGATDIAKGYASAHSNIRYLDHEAHVNLGLTISRNRGIERANGDFIAFLDADDCWLPEKLTGDMHLFMENPSASMICHASIFWYSWDDADKPDVYKAVGAEQDILHPPMSLTKKLYPLGFGAPPCPSGIMIRTAVLKHHGGFEESFKGIYGLYEDQAFLAKIYLYEPVFISGKTDNLYRKHAGSMTDSLKDLALYEKVRGFFLHWFLRYLDMHSEIPAEINMRVTEALRLIEKEEEKT